MYYLFKRYSRITDKTIRHQINKEKETTKFQLDILTASANLLKQYLFFYVSVQH